MSLHASECEPLDELMERLGPADAVVEEDGLRWELIQRARRDLRVGLYDDKQHVDSLLDACLDSIIQDGSE